MKYTRIVWDGKKLEPPCEMGCPKNDQLQGSDLDNLIELCGRVCYSSLGTGRNSVDYHKHIVEVGHLSVYEHANLTFAVPLDVPTYLACAEALLNRPGVWTTKEIPSIMLTNNTAFIMRITANLRAIREWHEYPPANKMATVIGSQIQYLSKEKAPLALSDLEVGDTGFPMRIVESKYEEEKWVSMFFANVSRGFSHELVRHKFQTAVSQRCLAGDTQIKFSHKHKGKAVSYTYKSIKNLYELRNHKRLYAQLYRMHINVLDETKNEFTISSIKDVVYSGKKPVFKTTLKTGNEIKCTVDHKILTNKGWKTLKEISNPQLTVNNIVTWDKDETLLLATNGEDSQLYRNKAGHGKEYSANVVRPGESKIKKNPRYVEIENITYCGEEDTYDLVLEDPHHNFVANGIVVHNSTRYVDEGDSPWCWHPLILNNVDLNKKLITGTNEKDFSLNQIQKFCQDGYKALVDKLQTKLIEEGTDKFTARKQARGAARGLLGNALNTELIFSANLAQWKWMFHLRAASAADAEIRVVMNEAFENLCEKFSETFSNYEKTKCPDGIGYSLKEKQ